MVIGTYHQSVAQFDFDLEHGTAERKWVDDTSSKSITAIVFNGFYCIYGGNDEVVRIVKPSASRRVGELHEHRGSLTHLATFQSHLLSSSDDGKIYIWRIGASSRSSHFQRLKHKKMRNRKKKEAEKEENGEQTIGNAEGGDFEEDTAWNLECCMENKVGRKTRKKLDAEGLDVSSNINFKILSFSVHPSGRLLLSIDNQREMKIWDLIRAKCIVTVKMPVPAVDIQWSPDGNFYAIARERKVMVYTKEGALHRVLRPVVRTVDGEYPDRYQQTVVCFTFVTKEMVAIADLSARIVVYDVDSRSAVYRLSGHERDGEERDDEQSVDPQERASNETSRPRIRRVKSVSLMLPGEREPSVYVVSADNRGRICVWNVHDCLTSIIRANEGIVPRDDGGDGDGTLSMEEDGDLQHRQNGMDSEDAVDSSDLADDEKENMEQDVVMEAAPGDEWNDDEEEPDYTVDENGLFTFDSLMQVDTDTHITCMDVGIMGRDGAMYKWKRPKEIITKDGKPLDVDRKVNNFAKKHKAGGLASGPGGTTSGDANASKRMAIQRRRKKKRTNAQKMDISRFD